MSWLWTAGRSIHFWPCPVPGVCSQSWILSKIHSYLSSCVRGSVCIFLGVGMCMGVWVQPWSRTRSYTNCASAHGVTGEHAHCGPACGCVWACLWERDNWRSWIPEGPGHPGWLTRRPWGLGCSLRGTFAYVCVSVCACTLVFMGARGWGSRAAADDLCV